MTALPLCLTVGLPAAWVIRAEWSRPSGQLGTPAWGVPLSGLGEYIKVLPHAL